MNLDEISALKLTHRERVAIATYLALGQEEVGAGGWTFDDNTPEVIDKVAEKLIAQHITTPIVFIGVEGGIADWTEVGDVLVAIIDWDEVKQNPEYAADKLEEFSDPALAPLLDGHSRETLEEAAHEED